MTKKERFTGNNTFADGISEHYQFYENNKRISNEEVLKLLNKLDKENQELKLTSNLFSDRELKRLKKENASLRFEKRNANYVLNDFMNLLNRIQYYFTDDIQFNDLDHKDFEDLKKLAEQSRDMLQLMDKDLKK